MCDELKSQIKEFISLLEKTEISDSGKEFHPNQIDSCRVMDGLRLGEILKSWKELNYNES